MKAKYLRMNKKERKEAKVAFYATENGTFIRKKLRTSLTCGILCILLSIYLIMDAFINNLSIWDKIYGFSILVFGLFFIICYRIIYVKKINEYVVKKKSN